MEITFSIRSLYHNPVRITFLPRVRPLYVLAHLCFRSNPSQFGFLKIENQKKTLKKPLQVITIMSINSNPDMKKLTMKYGLFRTTQEYHKKCLKKIFLKHYEPLVKGSEPNKHWTTHLSPEVMEELRLHLSWTRGGDVTHWTDHQIGKYIVKSYQKSKELPFLISEIRKREYLGGKSY